MTQHDYVIDNQTFPNTRTDLNNLFQSILTNNSGASEPSTTASYMNWADTSNNLFKFRNSADSDWVTYMSTAGNLLAASGSVSSPSISFSSDTNTGFYSYESDVIGFSAGNSFMGVISDIGIGVRTSSPSCEVHALDSSNVVSGYQYIAEGGQAAYGAGYSFQSKLAVSGVLAEMARITADGDNPWSSTDPLTQDASLRFFTCEDGTLSERFRMTYNGNLCIGNTLPNFSTNSVLCIENGTITTSVANSIQITSADISAGNTTLSFQTEGTGCVVSETVTADTTIQINVNGTAYKLIAQEV